MVTQNSEIPTQRLPYTRDDVVQVVRGTTDIDDSVNTETTPFVALTIAAPSSRELRDVVVIFDMNKATTGWGVVETTASIQFAVGRTIDGTNYRFAEYVPSTALTGSIAADGRSITVNVGDIPAGHTVRIYADASADVTADIELPYQVMYRGASAPTITEVAA